MLIESKHGVSALRTTRKLLDFAISRRIHKLQLDGIENPIF